MQLVLLFTGTVYIRPNKKNCMFSVHPSKFFQVGRAVFFFFFFFFSNEAYLVFIIQWGTITNITNEGFL